MTILSEKPNYSQLSHCGTSLAFYNKLNLTNDPSAFGSSFKATQLTPEQLAEHILNGRAWTPGLFKCNTRRNDTFISSEFVVFDLDNNVSVADALHNSFMRQYAMLVHPSASSSPQCYKTRVIFRLSEPVEGVERYRTIARALAEYIGMGVDPASWKPAQPYFGSTNRIEEPHINFAAVLPVELVGAFTEDLATDDYLRETTRLTYSAVDVGSRRVEKYAAATLKGAVDDYMKLPAGAKVRHDGFVKLSARLIGMKLGDWPGLENVEALLRDAGRATERTEREITDAIQWAHNATPIPLRLPNNETAEFAAAKHTRAEWFPVLPDSWRSSLLNYFKSIAAVLIEMFFQAVTAGHINPECFCISELCAANQALGFNIPQATLYRAVEELVGVFFSKSDTKETPQGIPVSNLEKNSRRGRKAACYSLFPYSVVKAAVLASATPRIYERSHDGVLARPTAYMMQDAGVGEAEAATVAGELDEIFADAYREQGHQEHRAAKRARRKQATLEQDLDNWHSTPLPVGWPLDTASKYQAAFLHAIVKLDQEKPRTRRDLADIVGSDVSSITAVRERASLKAHKHNACLPITSSHDFEAQVRQYGRQVRGYMLHIVSRSGEWEKVIDRQEIERELADGAQVFAEFQLPNTYEVVTETPPPVIERKKPRPTAISSRPARYSEYDRSKRYFGPHYDPLWIMAQLKLALRLLGWPRVNGEWVNPDTGEFAPENLLELIELLIDRKIHPITKEGVTDTSNNRL